MTKSAIIFFIIFFLTIPLSKMFAQEMVVGTNSSIVNSIENRTNLNKDYRGNDTLSLPFFDDFSHNEVSPRQDLWQDISVYINSKFADDAPTVGFATFDLLNSYGAIYPGVQYEFAFEADTLTSKPIDIDNTMIGLELSFYYRPQGNGDAPETKDSLLLDFYSEGESKWYNVWAKAGTGDHAFTLVTIPVVEGKFLQKGFKFRFRNYASLGASSYASLASNADQWHIDVIYLNKNRTPDDIHEVAFTNSLKSMLLEFESVPWQHYKSLASVDNQLAIMTNEVELSFRNLDNTLRSTPDLRLIIEDTSGENPTKKISYNSFNIPPSSNTVHQRFNPEYSFPETSNNEAEFIVSMAFNNDKPGIDSVSNNIITRRQIFKNYYAYDDGSAEAGYGLTGTGTKFGQIAYQFSPLKADAIIGVEIFFCQTLNDASNKYFWLDIREKSIDGDYPSSETIYQLEGVRPEYENEINKFHYYEFIEPVYVTSDFYVGWTQTTDDLLNVGLDLNGDAKSKLMFNVGSGWNPSTIDGAIMIRPVFDGNYAPTKSISQEFSENELPAEIGPNPVTNMLNINLPAEYYNETINISVTDIYGRKIINITNSSKRELDFSKFNKGVYIITISSTTGKYLRKKLIKN